jgi:ATP-dependent RNA helicase RhlE
LREFKNKQLSILIGTDVLSRGIDVEGISLVINFDVPPDPEDYIHRIGRTARADTTGTAITFINPLDQRKFQRIENLIGREVEKGVLPEGFGEAPVYSPSTQKESSGRKPFNKGRRPQGKPRQGPHQKRH